MASESTEKSHWLGRYNISTKALVFVSVLWTIFAVGFYHSSSSEYLETKIATPINFQIRDLVGATPKQDPRLKIFVFDDHAFSEMGDPLRSVELWGDLLDGFAEKKPKMIFVDAMFSSKPAASAKDLSYYFSRLEDLKVPVVTGAFLNPSAIRFRNPLSLDDPWFNASKYLASRDAGALSGAEWPLPINRSHLFAYGPAKELEQWFHRTGHLQLFQENKVEPFIYLGNGKVLPHASMFAADNIVIQNSGITFDGRRVALDRHGSLDINFLPVKEWHMRSLIGAIKDVKAGYKPDGVNPGDVVLILPLYFTGNTDFRPSPYGLVPGGLVFAATINSVLSGQWLQSVLATEVFVTFGIIALTLALVTLQTLGFWLVFLAMEVAVFFSAQVAFAKFGLILPWLLPSIAWLGFALNVFILKMRSDERKVLVLKSALDGAVGPSQMQQMLRKPESVNFEARERVLTLMFIDVVGFSLSAENMLPRVAFDTLKEILMEMGRIVHDHGGIVDKTLGDGLLCYFGYRFDTDETTTDHAERALNAAIRIQESNIERNMKSITTGEPLFPLRIGINTASSYLGDIGSGQRIEFTVVGNGVNFAKRLEGACEMFSVLVGPTTWELIKAVDINKKAITRKLVRIKHHKELIDAYEYDPMYHRRELRLQIAEAFRRSANLQRLNERVTINDTTAVKAISEYGDGAVVNFSGTGISLQFRTPLRRGQVIRIALESRIPGLRAALRNIGINELEAEVRWNYQSAGGFVHGLLFRNMEEDLREKFVRSISDFAFIGDPGSQNEDDANEAS